MRIVYLTTARLPTEKANGLQIVRMCEAFAGLGCDMHLVHPYRRQSRSELSVDPLHYYGVRHPFEIKTLPNIDIAWLSGLVPARLFTSISWLYEFLWGLILARYSTGKQATVFYTREPAIAYWLVRLGQPTVYEAHVVPKRGNRWLLQQMTRHPSLQLVVVLTSFIKERLVGIGFPAERIIVLPDAVDLSLFEGVPGQEACRRQLGLPLDRPIIGYIGRFHTLGMEKGIPELIEAMAHLLSVNGQTPLLLCVGGPMDAVPAYLEHARRFGVSDAQLKFVDHVPNAEVPRWIRACDVCTIPWPWNEFSAYYTSPMKLFEYMAAEVPIVASDLPSLREVLHDGENAVLVPPDDPHALAEGIRRVLADPSLAARISSQARREARQYTWEARAQHILTFIRMLDEGAQSPES